MVAWDKQWYPTANNDGHLNFWDYQPPKMAITQ